MRSGSKGLEKRTQKRSPLTKPSEKAQKRWSGREREKPQRGRGEEGFETVVEASLQEMMPKSEPRGGSSVKAGSFFKAAPAGADPGSQSLMHSEARAEPSPAPQPIRGLVHGAQG